MPKQKAVVQKVKKPNKAKAVKTYAPLAANRVIKTQAPKGKTSGDHDQKSHCEMIASFRTTDFTPAPLQDVPYTVLPMKTFALNPGLSSSFPWLFKQASGYESYKFTKLSFKWQPACAATTPGAILLAVDFDPLDPAPSSLLQMANYQGATRGDVWTEVVAHVNLADSRNKGEYRFVRSELTPESIQNISLYDLGNCFVAFPDVDFSEDIALGSLYVDFTVDFKTPQMDASGEGTMWEGRAIFKEGSMLYQDTQSGSQKDMYCPVGNSQEAVDVQAFTEYSVATGDMVAVKTGDPIDPHVPSYPVQFYNNIITAVDSDPAQIEYWTQGFVAYADVDIDMKVGFRQADIYMSSRQLTKPALSDAVLGWWETEVALWNNNRTEMQGHILVSNNGSPTVSGSYFEGTYGTEWNQAGSCTTPFVTVKATIPRGFWLTYHTYLKQFTPSGSTGVAEVCCSTYYNPTGGENIGNGDTPWWEVVLKAIPTVINIVQAIVGLFALPAALQDKLRMDMKTTMSEMAAARKAGNFCCLDELPADHKFRAKLAAKETPYALVSPRVDHFLALMDPSSPTYRHKQARVTEFKRK